jgi:hypothetical protein
MIRADLVANVANELPRSKTSQLPKGFELLRG